MFCDNFKKYPTPPFNIFKMRHLTTLLLCLFFLRSYAQHDTIYLKVHILYGSKPLKKYKDTEAKWFGGILGGHIGIEGDSDKIVNFIPRGKFHRFAQNRNKHSAYTVHSVRAFYKYFRNSPDSVKKAIVYIPVTVQQQQQFDSIAAVYLRQAPYDYAFLGMRCSAAAHDILGQLAIMPDYGYPKTWRKVFYPRKFRKRLYRKAKAHHWKIERENGSVTRKWDHD